MRNLCDNDVDKIKTDLKKREELLKGVEGTADDDLIGMTRLHDDDTNDFVLI